MNPADHYRLRDPDHFDALFGEACPRTPAAVKVKFLPHLIVPGSATRV